MSVMTSRKLRDTGLISIKDIQEIIYADTIGHVTDDIMRSHDIIVVT